MASGLIRPVPEGEVLAPFPSPDKVNGPFLVSVANSNRFNWRMVELVTRKCTKVRKLWRLMT
jgi:hypothetical protein